MTPEKQVAASLARADFYFFTRHMFRQLRGYTWQKAAHHQIICDALMRVWRGECKRLIINIPPRYSKTEIAVVNFIAWCLGKNPDCEFIHASYSARLAANNSYNSRSLVQHEEYSQIFPGTVLRDDSKAKDEWKTTDGGCVYATGAGGTITGFGAGKHRDGFAGCILVDDPHKPDEATSDVMRQNVIDWFQNTLESRKNSPNTPIIVIMQRLHERDLAGWLLDGGNGESWEHVCLPAITEDGDALWPEKHSIEILRQMQNAAPYVFSGQYMQRPSPADGGIFKPDKIEVVEAIPAGVTMVRAWDFAATLNGGDWTVGAKIGKLSDGRCLIADIVRLQGSPDDVRAALKNTAERDSNKVRVRLPQDPGQAGKAQAASMVKMLSGFTVIAQTVSGDKQTRAEPLASQVNVGNVLMLRAGWNDKVVDEMRMFPNGVHDDIIDALSDAFTELFGGGCGADALLEHMRKKYEQQQKDKNG